MITIKTQKEIQDLNVGGKRLAKLLHDTAKLVAVGVSAKTLDEYFRIEAEKLGDIPSFLNYTPEGHHTAFPASVCISVNDEIVHGIPKANKIFKKNDVVKVDGGLIHKGLFTDSAITVVVGSEENSSEKTQETNDLLHFINVCKVALYLGIAEAKAGNHAGDIGFAIETYVKQNSFSIIKELSGHGVGYKVHEDPYIPNYGKKGEGALLKDGMVIAIEPIIAMGKRHLVDTSDGYTLKTKDGSHAAQFEHTIAINGDNPIILTEL